jgi:hypothetical protein
VVAISVENWMPSGVETRVPAGIENAPGFAVVVKNSTVP